MQRGQFKVKYAIVPCHPRTTVYKLLVHVEYTYIPKFSAFIPSAFFFMPHVVSVYGWLKGKRPGILTCIFFFISEHSSLISRMNHPLISSFTPSKVLAGDNIIPLSWKNIHTPHCKKRLAVFPSPTVLSLTTLSLAGNNLII